ncbi:unnamed protein product, partial [Meganyctiphanes norvegica]|uniref:BED-type domain-containing protein n=1 Tax=Meganyctiphanes norvegica TaxID=48144 RepID=A0AAV2QS81_MEGNR
MNTNTWEKPYQKITNVTRYFLEYTMEEDSMTDISGVSDDSQGDKDYVQPPSGQERSDTPSSTLNRGRRARERRRGKELRENAFREANERHEGEAAITNEASASVGPIWRRESTGVLWKHVKREGNWIQCNHCPKRLKCSSSTTTAMSHLKNKHYEKYIADVSPSSSSGAAPSVQRCQRTLNKYIKRPTDPYPRTHGKCQEMDRNVALLIVKI